MYNNQVLACLDDHNETTRLVTIKVILKLLLVCGASFDGKLYINYHKIFHFGKFKWLLRVIKSWWYSGIVTVVKPTAVTEVSGSINLRTCIIVELHWQLKISHNL